MQAVQPRRVDQTGLKSGQALTIMLLLVAFVFASWQLVALVALAQFLGAMGLSFAPYRLIYRYIVQPTGLVKPHIIADNPEPHRFALFVGALVNTMAVIALTSGGPLLGWVLVILVIGLANLNLWMNFCLGCWCYYQLNRLGVPGFDRAPLL
jgi:hypothetical protein